MNEEARATHEQAIDPSVACSACIDPKRIKLSVNWNGRQHLNLYDLGDTFGTRCWSQTFQRQNLIIFILDPKYSFELNQKAGDIYMNRAAIDEENQIEISGVYHLDHWETFVESIEKYKDNRIGLEEFIKNRTDSQSNHKQIIAEAIER